MRRWMGKPFEYRLSRIIKRSLDVQAESDIYGIILKSLAQEHKQR
jgi:hypothetical protein